MISSREVTVFQLTLPEAVKQTLLALQTGYTPTKPATCLERHVTAALASLTAVLLPGLFGKELQHNKAPGTSSK